MVRRTNGYGAVTALSFALTIGVVAVAFTQTAAQSGGPRFRADGWQSDEYGRTEGYPAAARAKGEQKKFLIGSYSRWDTLEMTREIAAPRTASPLARSPAEPAI